jgi:hypothetical protein
MRSPTAEATDLKSVKCGFESHRIYHLNKPLKYNVIMAGRYCIITELEMDNIFKAEKKWNKEYYGLSSEIVYTKIIGKKPWIQVKVYSSIKKNSGLSAGIGQDAIRVCAVNLKTDRGLIKTNRINRVPNWDKRLVAKVEDVWKKLMES